MKTYVLMMAAALLVSCSTTQTAQRCRDKSDSAASISYDYCVWNQQQLTSNDEHPQRTTGEWYILVAWPSTGTSSGTVPAQTRVPANTPDRIFR